MSAIDKQWGDDLDASEEQLTGEVQTRCRGCEQHIDPDVCCCGSGRDDGHDNHVFTPMGCNCHRVDPTVVEKPEAF